MVYKNRLGKIKRGIFLSTSVLLGLIGLCISPQVVVAQNRHINKPVNVQPHRVTASSKVRPLVFAYVLNTYPSNTISQYQFIDGHKLSRLTPPAIVTGSDPTFAALDRIGHHLYVIIAGANIITEYSIGINGSLSLIEQPLADKLAVRITVSPSGHFAYILETDGNVSQYKIAKNGALHSLSPKSVATGFAPWEMVISRSGRYAYILALNHNEIIGRNASLYQYRISNDGILHQMNPVDIPNATINFPYGLNIDPLGRFATVNTAQGLLTFHITSSGMFDSLDRDNVDTPCFVINDKGTLAFSMEQAQDEHANILASYTISPDGELNLLNKYIILENGALINQIQYTTAPRCVGIYSLTFDPNNKYLFAVSAIGDKIFQYKIAEMKSSADASLVSIIPTMQPWQILFSN